VHVQITNMRALVIAGLVALLVQLGAFFYFGSSSYNAKLKTKFLSLSEDAGVCEPVSLFKTQTFYVDKFGTWDTETTFKSQEALFVVKFTGYQGTDATWKIDMAATWSAIDTEMEYLRSIADLPTKILHLISWRKTITANTAGTILVWFNADPTYIFDIPGSQLDAVMGAKVDSCVENDSWGMKDGILTLTFDDVWKYGTWLNNGDDQANISSTWTCKNFDITENGYNVGYPTESFNLQVDLSASATVAALNAGVMASTDLLSVADKLYIFKNDDTANDEGYLDYAVSFDPKYPDMTAVYSDITASTKTYQQRIGYSLWNVQFSGWHYSWQGSGNNDKWDDSTFAGPYNCPSKCTTGAQYCSTPDFVFEYTQTGSTQTFKVNIYADEMFTINQDNMDPGHFGCKTSDTGSGNKLGLLEPTSADAFQANMNTVNPFKLTEDYFSCTPEPMTAFFDALGIAQGNATLFVAVAVAFIMFFAGRAGIVATTVSDDEIAENSKTLAEALKFMKLGKVDQMTSAHKKLRVAIKAFLEAEEDQAHKVKGTSLDGLSIKMLPPSRSMEGTI
jgi:hypothetical protein